MATIYQHPQPTRSWRNRTKVALACAVVSATAMLPVACGMPGGGNEAEAGPAPQAVASTPAVDDEAAVKQVFLDFEKAGQEQDAAKALGLVSESSKEYYEDLRKLALSASKASLQKKRLVEQVTVLGLRADTDKEVLREGDLEALIGATMKAQGQEGSGTTAEDLAKTKVTVTGDTAVLGDTEDPSLKFELVREQGAWKVDVRSVMTMFDEVLSGLVEMTGMTKTAFVEKTMAEQVGSEAKARRLWKPVGTGSA